MAINWYTIVPVILLVIGMSYSIYRYFSNREIYNELRIGYRKVYYVYMLILGALFWMFDVFPAENLSTLGAFLVGVVVMDLFVFQTPDITKFMSNEFKHDGGLVNQLKETEGSSIRMRQQLQFVNNYMPKRDSTWELEDRFDYSEEEFRRQTEGVVQRYGNEFDLNVVQFLLSNQNGTDEEADMSEESLEAIVDYLFDEFELNNNMLGMRKKKLIEKLKEQESIEFFKKKQGAVIFPYRGEYTDMVYYVYPKVEDETENRIHATGYDALLLMNMLHTFDLYAKSVEADILD